MARSTGTTGLAQKAYKAAITRLVAAHHDEFTEYRREERASRGLTPEPINHDSFAVMRKKLQNAEALLLQMGVRI